MAQTKRKRRSKHRGNAAGTVEARGRTSRSNKLSPAEEKKRAREDRMNKPPTWKSAATKAGLMSVFLFVLTQIGLLGNNMPIATSIFFAAAALVIYTPLAYATDSFVYKRVQARRAKAGAKR
jgi:uncharacterized membrane-anchored protein